MQEVVKTPPIELQMIFDFTDEELEDTLTTLQTKGYITLEEVGTGSFIYYLGKPLVCDPVTGVCSY